ncbi:MAG: hypothetical protein JRF56_04860 [Deltaproteobacteria bacterium]|nr:hypothetical protein [Deltaproteobacteria bacterium]
MNIFEKTVYSKRKMKADQNGCVVKQKRIHSDMQHLILEAARRKDENISQEARPSVVSVIEELEPFESDHLFRLP